MGDRCCTLRITRPNDEEVEKYSGVYKKKGGRTEESGGVNGSPIYVKEGSDGSIWMQVSIGTDYDYETEDYEDFPNWGIMDDKEIWIYRRRMAGRQSSWGLAQRWKGNLHQVQQEGNCLQEAPLRARARSKRHL